MRKSEVPDVVRKKHSFLDEKSIRKGEVSGGLNEVKTIYCLKKKQTNKVLSLSEHMRKLLEIGMPQIIQNLKWRPLPISGSTFEIWGGFRKYIFWDDVYIGKKLTNNIQK